MPLSEYAKLLDKLTKLVTDIFDVFALMLDMAAKLLLRISTVADNAENELPTMLDRDEMEKAVVLDKPLSEVEKVLSSDEMENAVVLDKPRSEVEKVLSSDEMENAVVLDKPLSPLSRDDMEEAAVFDRPLREVEKVLSRDEMENAVFLERLSIELASKELDDEITWSEEVRLNAPVLFDRPPPPDATPTTVMLEVESVTADKFAAEMFETDPMRANALPMDVIGGF